MSLPITALTASVLSLLLLALSFRVIGRRRELKISLGDGGDETMIRRQRAMGNLVEYAPFGIVLVLLAEMQGLHWALLWLLALALVAGRIAHGYALAFTDGFVPGRMYGMYATVAALAGLSVVNIIMALF